MCGGGDRLVVVSMAQNNAPLQVYDLDSMDFVVIEGAHAQRTDIELAHDLVGEGRLVMFK